MNHNLELLGHDSHFLKMILSCNWFMNESAGQISTLVVWVTGSRGRGFDHELCFLWCIMSCVVFGVETVH